MKFGKYVNIISRQKFLGGADHCDKTSKVESSYRAQVLPTYPIYLLNCNLQPSEFCLLLKTTIRNVITYSKDI